jgi:diguanylate cyclase (GGDEF)-like protein
METAAADQNKPLSEPDFARLRLFKGADISNIESLLEECPIYSLDEEQSLPKTELAEYSLLVLLSGRLELSQKAPGMADVVTAGDYIGGLNPVGNWQKLSNYQAIQSSRVIAFDDEMLKSLTMVSHSAAVNLSALAMDQLKRHPAANDASSAQEADMVSVGSLPAPKLHDAKWLEELLDRQIIRSLTDREPLSLAVLEIDNVASYLDKHGEEALKYVSNSVAHSILDNVRPGDICARIDDVHFVIVLPRAGAKDAFRPAERLVEKIQRAEVDIPDDCTLPPVTVSIGLAQLKAMVGAEKFVAEAIEALERAKQNGPCSISD